MKKTLVLAAAFALAACASTEKSASTAAPAQVAGSTLYCWQDKLIDAGGNLTCNWESTAEKACEASYPTPLSKSAVRKGPDKVRMCANGQWLVQVTTG